MELLGRNRTGCAGGRPASGRIPVLSGHGLTRSVLLKMTQTGPRVYHLVNSYLAAGKYAGLLPRTWHNGAGPARYAALRYVMMTVPFRSRPPR